MPAERRAYWKGYLKLSLVTTPVALFPAASRSEKSQFHQINRKTGNRLRQQMVDEETGEVVDRDDKTRGYELAKGRYVEVDPKEIRALQIEAKHTLDIEKFVPLDEIDRRYYDKAYYITPDGRGGEEAFAVIRDAMKNKNRVALARIVLTNREHIMAIEPFGKGMLGTTLHYTYEVRDESEFFQDLPEPQIPKEMVDLAAHILDTKAGHFDTTQFTDQYEQELRKLVERKAAGQVLEAPMRREGTSNIVSLMEALRRSVEGTNTPNEGRGKATRSAKPNPADPSRKSTTRKRKAMT